MIAGTIGSVTSFLGAWSVTFSDGATGGIIVVAQTLPVLFSIFVFAPTHGLLANLVGVRIKRGGSPMMALSTWSHCSSPL
ncbi:hypothetical protein ACNKHX_08360 [Shigella flexneri]